MINKSQILKQRWKVKGRLTKRKRRKKIKRKRNKKALKIFKDRNPKKERIKSPKKIINHKTVKLRLMKCLDV